MNQALQTLSSRQRMTQNADPVFLAEPVSVRDRGDDALMLLARGGRRDAFEVLVERYQKQVLSVAYKKVQNSSQAADVAQNTFLELFRYVPKYQAKGRFSPLLFRILFNECNKVFRGRGYANRAQELLTRSPVVAAEMPDCEILKLERRREVERALGKLSKKLRDVLVLRFTADLSYKEIGLQLEIPVGTVKSRIAAGMDKMRQVLEEEQAAL